MFCFLPSRLSPSSLRHIFESHLGHHACSPHSPLPLFPSPPLCLSPCPLFPSLSLRWSSYFLSLYLFSSSRLALQSNPAANPDVTLPSASASPSPNAALIASPLGFSRTSYEVWQHYYYYQDYYCYPFIYRYLRQEGYVFGSVR